MAETAKGERKRKAYVVREGGSHVVEPEAGRGAQRDGGKVKDVAGRKDGAVEAKEGEQ